MKYIYGIIASAFFAILFIGGSTTMSSCTKTVTEYDTITQHDTVIVRDTVCDCESGLVAKYTFTGASLADSSGYGNNINFNSATATTDRKGVANNAFLFNGTSSYMTVPNSNTLNPTNITLFAIVKLNGFYQGSCRSSQILGKGTPDDVQGFYALRTHDAVHNCGAPFVADKQRFTGQYGDNFPQGSAAGTIDTSKINTGQWYAIAYTYDGKESRLYVNGVLVDARPKVVTFTANNNALYIGKHDSSMFPYYFNGVIDEIRIYNHAICASGIKTLSK